MTPLSGLSALAGAAHLGAHAAHADGGSDRDGSSSPRQHGDEQGAQRLHRALTAAVDTHVITAAQRDAILVLDRAAAASRVPPPDTEARPGFHWVSVAYVLGALVVLFAFGWILADRWTALADRGVLALSLLYAALFAGVSRWLYANGWRTAGGWAAVCAVGMTPVIVWALQGAIDLWPASGAEYLAANPRGWDDAGRRMAEASRALVTELATVLVALVTLRRLRVTALVTPIAAALPWIPFSALRAVREAGIYPHTDAWLLAATAAAIFWIAYSVARHQFHESPRESGAPLDYARWLYVSSMLCTLFAIWNLWGAHPEDHHALLPFALALIAGSLVLRRRSVLATGVLLLLFYLGWLANELFRGSIAFPIALATIGLTTILCTVWLQSRFPALVRRGHALTNAPRLPGNHLLPALALGVALLMLVPAQAADVDARRAQYWRQAFWRRRNAVAARSPRTPRTAPAAPAAER